MAKLKLNTKALVQLRVARGLTPAALVDRIELLSKNRNGLEPIKVRTIERHEKEIGIVDVHEGTIAAYAAGLSVDPDYLTGEDLTSEQIRSITYDPVQEIKASTKLPDGYETRLVKYGEDSFMLAEFTSSNKCGRIIAKDIPDAETGGRLSSYSSIIKELNVAFHILQQISTLQLENMYVSALVEADALTKSDLADSNLDRFIGENGQQIPGLEVLEWMVKLSKLIETGESVTDYSDAIHSEAIRLLSQQKL